MRKRDLADADDRSKSRLFHTRRDLLYYAAAVAGAAGMIGSGSSALAAGADPWFDVTTFGAKGDGVTDDTAAIASATAAANAAGGGVVFFPGGIYLVSNTQSAPGIAGHGAVRLYDKCSILGAGRGATVLRLAANLSGNGNAVNLIVVGNDVTTSGRVADLTLDGNAANNTDASNCFIGWQCSNVVVERLVIQNTIGGSGEQAGLQFLMATRSVVRDVVVDQNGNPNSGAGIGWSECESCVTENCFVTGVGGGTFNWRCFVCDGSTDMTWVGCKTYNNSVQNSGIDCNGSLRVRYISCQVGDRSPAQWQSFPPLPGDGSSYDVIRPHAGAGFNVTGSQLVDLIGCTSVYCGSFALRIAADARPVQSTDIKVIGGLYGYTTNPGKHGILIDNAATNVLVDGVEAAGNSAVSSDGIRVAQPTNTDVTISNCLIVDNGTGGAGNCSGINQAGQARITITGCTIKGNSFVGLWFPTAAATQATRVSNCRISANGSADWSGPGLGSQPAQAGATLGLPPIPASGTSLANPYPFDMVVYLSGGAYSAGAASPRSPSAATASCRRRPTRQTAF